MATGGGEGDLTVTLNPLNTGRGGTTGGVAGSMDAIVAGAAGAITYAWTVTIPDPTYALTIGGPATSHASFDFGAVANGDIAEATVRCTVTDGVRSAYSEGTVTFVNRNPAP